MFLGPLEAMKPWSPRGIEGVHRFLQKVWHDCVGEDGRANPKVADGRGGLRRAPEAAPRDDPQGGRRHRGPALQHGHLADDDLRERAPQGGAGQPRDRARLPPAPRAVRAPLRRGGLVAPGRPGPRPRRRPGRRSTRPRRRPAEVRLVFQVNGKHRGDQLVPVGLPQEEAVALARLHPKVAPFLGERPSPRWSTCRAGYSIWSCG